MRITHDALEEQSSEVSEALLICLLLGHCACLCKDGEVCGAEERHGCVDGVDGVDECVDGYTLQIGSAPPSIFFIYPPFLTNVKKTTKEIGFRLLSFGFVFWFFCLLVFLSLLAPLVGAAALLAAGCQRVVRHLRAARQAAERVATARALSRRGRARPPVLLGRARARAPVDARRGRPRPVECGLRLSVCPLWLADVRHALARLRALAQRAEFARVKLLAAGLERALFVVAVGVHDELGAGRREAALDALVGVAAAADDATVGVARPDIRILDERDCHGRGRGVCTGCKLGGGLFEQGRNPGVDWARVARVFLFLHVCPVARLLGEPVHLSGQGGQSGLVAQHLREHAVLVVARRAEHLTRASPVRDVSLLGRLRARCALVLALVESEREAVLRHCCCVGGYVGWRGKGNSFSLQPF